MYKLIFYCGMNVVFISPLALEALCSGFIFFSWSSLMLSSTCRQGEMQF